MRVLLASVCSIWLLWAQVTNGTVLLYCVVRRLVNISRKCFGKATLAASPLEWRMLVEYPGIILESGARMTGMLVVEKSSDSIGHSVTLAGTTIVLLVLFFSRMFGNRHCGFFFPMTVEWNSR